MLKLTVLFGRPEDPEAFEAYYTNYHLPLAAKLPNVGDLNPAGSMPSMVGSHRTTALQRWATRSGESSSPVGRFESRRCRDLEPSSTTGVMFLFSEV